MIDLHTHTFFSDGVLIPSELARRCENAGLTAIAITDHVDTSNLDHVVAQIAKVCSDLNRYTDITVIPGIEITHVPPQAIGAVVKSARSLGAQLIVLHGETVCEPVKKGTNLAGLEAGIDILAHPGLITEKEVALAVKKSVYLEITTRKGHSLTNGHVAKMAKLGGAKMVVNSDTHEPGDIMTLDLARKTVLGAGLSPDTFEEIQNNSKTILENL